MAKKIHPSDIGEAAQIDRAAYFTACRRIEGGRYDTRKCATLADADAMAKIMDTRRTMVYAVTPEGLTIAVTERNRPLLKGATR